MTQPVPQRSYFKYEREAVHAAVFLLFVVLVIFPACRLLVQSLYLENTFSLIHYKSVVLDSRVFGLFLRSLGMAGGATVLSLVIGVPLALGLVKRPFPGRTVCSVLVAFPLLIPSHILTLAWISLCGKNGYLHLAVQRLFAVTLPTTLLYNMFGAMTLLFLSYFPLVVLLAMAGLRGSDQALEEAGAMHQRPLVVLRSITLPLIAPYCLAGGVFVFILSFFNYGVPAMLRVPSYPGEIFTRFSAMNDIGGTAALVAPVVLLCFFLLVIQWRAMRGRQYTALSARSVRMEPHRKPATSWPVALPVYSWLLVSAFLPIAALAGKAGGLAGIATAWSSSTDAIYGTCIVAALSSILATGFAVVLVYCMASLPERIRRFPDILTFLPLAFPSFLVGIGLIQFWNRPSTEVIYGTGGILVLACIVRFVPFGVRIIESARGQVGTGIFEAAAFCRHNAAARWMALDFPLLRRGIVVSLAILFVFSSGELGATLLVIPPGMNTLSLKIYTIMHYGAGPMVAATALILVGINLFFTAVPALYDYRVRP